MHSDSDIFQLLHPAERELLLEFEDERSLGADQLADTIMRVVSQLQQHSRPPVAGTRYPGNVHTAEAGGKLAVKRAAKRALKPEPRRRSPEFSPIEKEVIKEMAEELEDIEKGSRRLPAVPTREEIAQLLDTVRQAADKKKRNARRDYLIIRLFYATGCRRSELEGMVKADLNTAEQRIFIRDGKGNKDRYVLIDTETARLLDQHTKKHKLDTPVFNIQDRQIARRVEHWGTVTGLAQRYDAQDRNFCTHSLRHSFATHMYEGGTNLFTLRELLGHRYLSTTRIYVAIGVGKLLADYRRSHPLCLAGGEFLG